ncbi:E3 ubiquitin protein ligase DRIP2 [Morella rubra]|uniref:E3 ubiquitin protein ligase DRIP2 n=1 Tax=Morella rubra TaxID=262757 RepID=A0A6A1W5J2_9ROSI|nr:E3 ubiquitin protein ligase DRIP2 [Morella rubra]
MTMPSQVVKVRKEKLALCMTCSLCNKLYKDAATISECLHTFCRKCITEKITDEHLKRCPVCKAELGCAPLEKLRVDNNVQDLRAKIFHSVGKKAKAPELVLSVPQPGKRREKSLSSLAFSTPRLLAQSGQVGRRITFAARKHLAPQESILFSGEPVNKEEEVDKKVRDHPVSSSSTGTPSETVQNRRQNPSSNESSKHYVPKKDKEEHSEERTHLWEPLNCLVEAASKEKSAKDNMDAGTVVKPAQPDAQDNEADVSKAKIKGNDYKAKCHGSDNDSNYAPSGSVRTKKLRGARKRRAPASEGVNIPEQVLADANSKRDTSFGPTWFSLIASADQGRDQALLPQLSLRYLRVKDGSLPISYLKKYLVKKLDLYSEDEVEIFLGGQPVMSTLQLHNLVDSWLQTQPASQRIETSVGSSAKEFVMVLTYGRKALPPRESADDALSHLSLSNDASHGNLGLQ